MHSFTITIEELVSEDFTIEADTREQAIEKAIKQYKEGALVLCPGSVEAKRIHVFNDDSDRWIEF